MHVDLAAIAARFATGRLDDLLEEDIRGERQATIERLWDLVAAVAPPGAFVGEDYDLEGDALDRELVMVTGDSVCRIKVSCVADYYTIEWAGGAPEGLREAVRDACAGLGLTYVPAQDPVLAEQVPGVRAAGRPATVYQALFA
jgi:hypothetical protein